MSKSPKVILEELRVHNGNAIADVVAIHSYAHCYEIKGDNDNIYRAVKQSHYYDLAFKKTTLVTTDKYIERAKHLLPAHWGLMRARLHDNDVRLSYVRAAKNNSSFDKKIALLTLWRSELMDGELLAEIKNLKKLNRDQLSDLIAEKLGQADLVKFIGGKLVSRKNYPGNELNI